MVVMTCGPGFYNYIITTYIAVLLRTQFVSLMYKGVAVTVTNPTSCFVSFFNTFGGTRSSHIITQIVSASVIVGVVQ